MAHLGVTRSGPPTAAHTLANRLVANPGDHATIEVMFGGFTAGSTRRHRNRGDGC